MKLKWNLIFCFALMLAILMIGWHSSQIDTKEKSIVSRSELKMEQNKETYQRKKVILFVIDSLLSSRIDEGVGKKQLPIFESLINRGYYTKNLVSAFPTMSVTIDSSLLTGTSPDSHHIPGLVWYDQSQQRIVNYGTGPMEIMKTGFNQVLEDALNHLNQNHLNPNVPTIFEELSKRKRTSGSINGLIYRGKTEHTLTFPVWLSGFTVLPNQTQVSGPNYFAFGSFTHSLSDQERKSSTGDRYGFNNRFALDKLAELIKNGEQPDFSLVYLPDMDQQIHEYGPDHQKSIRKLDRDLGTFFQQFGSLDEFLTKNYVILMGDSGQTKTVTNRREAVISLPDLLQPFTAISSGKVKQNTDLALAVNERMAYVYLLNPNIVKDTIISTLEKDPRIDLIAWKKEDWIYLQRGKKQLRFQQGSQFTDEYGEKWNVEGDFDTLGIRFDQRLKKIVFLDYPNAFQRIYASLHSHSGNFLIVTSKPGYELSGGDSPIHPSGGGHGSLDKSDSLIPLIILGTEERPKYLRIEDLKDYILQLLQ